MQCVQVTYMGSYLAGGVPNAWLIGVRKHSLNLLSDYDAFTKTHFGDPDYKGITLCKLRTLHQTGSCGFS